jgi:hypothetical protein
MADYAPSFTARYKLIYSFEGDTHQCVTRWPSADTVAANVTAARAFWANFLDQTAPIRHDTFTVLGAEYAPADSNTFFPALVPTGFLTGALSSASGPSTKIIHTIWSGRSTLGAKSRLMMFGLRWNTADSTTYEDFRVQDAENPIAGICASVILNSGQVGPDDEVLAQVYNRVTIKGNDAWVRIRRQGG